MLFLIVCFLIKLGEFFYVLDTSLLLNIPFMNVFSQSAACLFIFLSVSFAEPSFQFCRSAIYPVFFYESCFWSFLRTLLLIPGHDDFLLFSSMRFIVLHFDL